ncbi:MAG: hemerythrin domain-containing protein [Bryobacterales bacterium]|nr:hemerythrin domain-containing protein [Bryobacterales bacterium]
MDLMTDHRRIEAVMNALEKQLLVSDSFPTEFITKALKFFVEYADGFHHLKEEEHLFPAMVDRGVAVECGPIGVMLHDHAIGRQLLAGIRSQLEEASRGDPHAQTAVRDYALRYIDMLRQHIWKEDNVLFSIAQRVLDEPAADFIAERFASIRSMNVTPETVERHRQFADAASRL